MAPAPAEASDVPNLARALPPVEELPAGTLLFVLPTVAEPRSLRRSVLAALRREHTLPRALRCGALLLRGYTRIGAGIDEATGADLVWGYAPDASERGRP